MAKLTSVSVFCGTAEDIDPLYKAAARDLGLLLAAQGVQLVYGGARAGLMGIVSQACFRAGGAVTGIMPEHMQEKEILNIEVTEMIVVDSFHARKRVMVEKSDAFIVLPGGFGTLDEVFEVLTWKYCGMHAKPVAFVNINGFYDPLLATIDHMIASGFSAPWHRDLFIVAKDVKDALAAISAAAGPAAV
ncbi:MAG TPA: TIGR00730 family Rossman fold protein [Patescibacteria group bacterium]|nr:TIGR00730 family Rossman fold protein [Patescibacteria group bacterium]